MPVSPKLFKSPKISTDTNPTIVDSSSIVSEVKPIRKPKRFDFNETKSNKKSTLTYQYKKTFSSEREKKFEQENLYDELDDFLKEKLEKKLTWYIDEIAIKIDSAIDKKFENIVLPEKGNISDAREYVNKDFISLLNKSRNEIYKIACKNIRVTSVKRKPHEVSEGGNNLKSLVILKNKFEFRIKNKYALLNRIKKINEKFKNDAAVYVKRFLENNQELLNVNDENKFFLTDSAKLKLLSFEKLNFLTNKLGYRPTHHLSDAKIKWSKSISRLIPNLGLSYANEYKRVIQKKLKTINKKTRKLIIAIVNAHVEIQASSEDKFKMTNKNELISKLEEVNNRCKNEIDFLVGLHEKLYFISDKLDHCPTHYVEEAKGKWSDAISQQISRLKLINAKDERILVLKETKTKIVNITKQARADIIKIVSDNVLESKSESLKFTIQKENEMLNKFYEVNKRCKRDVDTLIQKDIFENPKLEKHRRWAYKFGKVLMNVVTAPISIPFRLLMGHWLFSTSTKTVKKLERVYDDMQQQQTLSLHKIKIN